MYGLINRAVQQYLRDTYGPELWSKVARRAQLPTESFDPMMMYDAAITRRMVMAAATCLDRPIQQVLEDLGTYLVAHPGSDVLRRLLRFGGVTFPDFLHSLEDLPGRGRMALRDLDLPELEVLETGPGTYHLTCWSDLPGTGHVVLGLLRAMADDYGALALLDHAGMSGKAEVITIHMLDQNHATGRRFDLSAAEAAP
jgi:hypothetical protein